MSLGLVDKLAVEELLARYRWCMDTGNIDGAAATFTTDATVRDVTGKLWDTAAGGARAFASHFLTQPDRPASQHWVQHIGFESIDNYTINVVSYWTVLAKENGGDGCFVRMLGCYRDRCVVEDGVWLTAEKIIDPWNKENMSLFQSLL